VVTATTLENGNAGNDVENGGAGDDTGGDGAESLDGGDGADVEVGSESGLGWERAQTITSGNRMIANRTGWCLTHLFQAGLVSRPSRGILEISEEGRHVVDSGPERLDEATFAAIRHTWSSGPDT